MNIRDDKIKFELRAEMVSYYNLYIGGKQVAAENNEYFASYNPYSGEEWARIAQGGPKDVDRAVSVASESFEIWARMTATDRGKLLLKLADLIEVEASRLAEIEVRDNGKLYTEMFGQTKYMAEWYRYYGGLADKVEGRVIPTDKANTLTFTKREPLGVVAMITPWNSPLLLLAWKLPAALAAGNTVVIKPSEYTSASTLEFVELFERAGFPDGVVNVVTGTGKDVGAPLVSHPKVAKVAFTGSDNAGRHIYQSAASDFKPVSLELGGKSPNIVFDDADLDAAISGVISGIFAASGQTCIAGSRLLLQDSVHDEFVDRLVEIAGKARIGDPMDPDTQIGPVTTREQYEKVLHYIALAQQEGASLKLGGGPYESSKAAGGQLIQPTIFTDVENHMRIAQEEVFGPVLSVIRFDDENDAIQKANDTIYGLAAGVWTNDIGRAIRVADAVQAGTVWVNSYRAVSYTTPFGGYKHSGLGRESGVDAINEFLQTKSVWISTAPYTGNPFVLR